MTLKKKGKFWYGTTQEDLQTEMRRYSVDNVCEATRYAARPRLRRQDLHAGHRRRRRRRAAHLHGLRQ